MIPKFKAKSIASENMGEWVHGTPIVQDGEAYMLNGVIEATDEYITIERWCPVDKETICMSTGFMGEGDQEVFEGDILSDGLSDDYSECCVVYYDKDHAVFKVNDGEWDDKLSDFWDPKIVGNKFDNPELLEVEDDMD